MLACAVCSNGARIRGHRSHVLPAGGSEDRSVQSGFVFLLERGQEAAPGAAGNTKLGLNACKTLVHSAGLISLLLIRALLMCARASVVHELERSHSKRNNLRMTNNFNQVGIATCSRETDFFMVLRRVRSLNEDFRPLQTVKTAYHHSSTLVTTQNHHGPKLLWLSCGGRWKRRTAPRRSRAFAILRKRFCFES